MGAPPGGLSTGQSSGGGGPCTGPCCGGPCTGPCTGPCPGPGTGGGGGWNGGWNGGGGGGTATGSQTSTQATAYVERPQSRHRCPPQQDRSGMHWVSARQNPRHEALLPGTQPSPGKTHVPAQAWLNAHRVSGRADSATVVSPTSSPELRSAPSPSGSSAPQPTLIAAKPPKSTRMTFQRFVKMDLPPDPASRRTAPPPTAHTFTLGAGTVRRVAVSSSTAVVYGRRLGEEHKAPV